MGKIVIDGVIFGLQKSGGISRVWADLILALDQQPHFSSHSTLLIPRNQNVEWQRIEPQLKNFKIYKRRRFRWEKRGIKAESFYLTMLAARWKPLLWQSTFYVGFPRAFCSKKIATLYDMIPEVLGYATPYETQLKYQTLLKADRVLSISTHSSHDGERIWPWMSEKTVPFPLFASPLIPTSSSALPSRPYFVYVGVRKGYKNFASLLKEFLSSSAFSSYELVVVGGEKAWSQEEEQIFYELGGKERVLHLGTLPAQDVYGVISRSSALLFPSLYEGFGLPLLEAFQLGVPVLANRCSSIPEVVGESYPLADPFVKGSFMQTLSLLLNEREKWVAYGKTRAQSFSCEQTLTHLLKNYKKILPCDLASSLSL